MKRDRQAHTPTPRLNQTAHFVVRPRRESRESPSNFAVPYRAGYLISSHCIDSAVPVPVPKPKGKRPKRENYGILRGMDGSQLMMRRGPWRIGDFNVEKGCTQRPKRSPGRRCRSGAVLARIPTFAPIRSPSLVPLRHYNPQTRFSQLLHRLRSSAAYISSGDACRGHARRGNIIKWMSHCKPPCPIHDWMVPSGGCD